MPSNNNDNGSIDLLLISNALDNINGEVVGGTTDYGMHYSYLYIGMSGQKLVDQMNANFLATDAQFLAHNNALNVRIVSTQIKEMKINNGIVLYTTDDFPAEDEEDTRTWTALQGQWGKITGTLSDQADLQRALESKANQVDFEALTATVGTNTNNILVLQGTVSDMSDMLNSISTTISGPGGILSRLTAAETTLNAKISSDGTGGRSPVLAIRTTSEMRLEFTVDGVNWYDVSTSGIISWGQIDGEITNQTDLRLIIENINDRIDDLEDDVEELNPLVSGHIANTSNPHNVTKSQIGLGNVDNTSDMDKPVSTAQQAAIDAATGAAKFKSLTRAEYEALTTKDANTFYFINDL